jgi:hypothetical protein
VTTVVIKNCEPLVPGPELAMDTVPALSCRSVLTISSSNSPPQMDVPPVPSPSGSPARPQPSRWCASALWCGVVREDQDSEKIHALEMNSFVRVILWTHIAKDAGGATHPSGS